MGKYLKEVGTQRIIYHLQNDFATPGLVLNKNYAIDDDTSNEYFKNRTHHETLLASLNATIQATSRLVYVNVHFEDDINIETDRVMVTTGYRSYDPGVLDSNLTTHISPTITVTLSQTASKTYTITLESSEDEFIIGDDFYLRVRRFSFLSYHEYEHTVHPFGNIGYKCASITEGGETKDLYYNNCHEIVDMRDSSDTTIEVLPAQFTILPTGAYIVNVSCIDYSQGYADGVNVEIKDRANTWAWLMTKPAGRDIFVFSDNDEGIEWQNSISQLEDGKTYQFEVVGNSEDGYFGNYWGTENIIHHR